MSARLFQNGFRRSLQFFLVFFGAFFCVPFFSLNHAQQPSITSDGTLGTNVSINQSNYRISEGTIHGGNQFHSFGRFNVLEGESAAFTGPNSINNIIGRVTGGSESFINGLLRSEITGANLYLLNPSGVLFGSNAQLDLSGSFHVSTADYLRLGENGIFYAALSDNSVLTMEPPSAFGFLSGNPGGISIDGSRLTVPDGETLSVVGGDINVKGGVLKAPSGTIKVASIGSSSEINARTSDVMDTQLNISSTNLNQVDISNQTYLDVSGKGAGTILIRGGKLFVEDSQIISNNYGNEESGGNNGNIEIDATKKVSLVNSLLLGENFADGGNGGALTVESENLAVLDGAVISTITYGAGTAGSIDIEADNILLSGKNSSQGWATGIYSGSVEDTTGNAGDLNIVADTLKVEAGAQIITSSFGAGKSGDLNLDAKHIRLTSVDTEGSDTSLYTGIFTEGQNGGDGGFINIDSQNLEITDGARISSRTFNSGTAGSIDVDADNILLSGRNSSQGWASGIFSNSYSNTTGNAGDLSITADTLNVEAGAQIITGSYGTGNGGSFNLDAKQIRLTPLDAKGSDTGFLTGIFAEGVNGGDGGFINIESQNLDILDGAVISSRTFNSGTAGNIDVNADNIVLSGRNSSQGWASAIYTGSVSNTTGNAGDLFIKTDTLNVKAGALVSTRAYGSGKSGDINLDAKHIRLTPVDAEGSNTGLYTGIFTEGRNGGDGGSLIVKGENLEILDGARISSRTFSSGAAGSIDVNAENISLSGTNSSQGWASGIFTGSGEDTTGNAGDLKITTDTLNVEAGAQISTSSYGTGKSGGLNLDAKHIRLTPVDAGVNDTGLLTGIFADGVNGGNGGPLTIKGENLDVLDGAIISSRTFSSGTAGSIDVEVDNILLSGRNSSHGRSSGIYALSTEDTIGNAGDIFIKTDTLDVKAGAIISTSTHGSGNGGDINIDARHIWLTPVDAEGIDTGLYTGIVARGINGGDSGNIEVTSDTIKIENGAQISSETMDSGNGGDVNLAAKDIQLTGYYTDGFYTWRSSGVFAGGSTTTGEAGSISIVSENLEILNDASISSATNWIAGGGNIDIISDTIKIEAGGSINTDTLFSGKGGNINLKAKYIRLTPVDASGSHTGRLTGIWAQGVLDADGGSITIESENLEILDGASISSATSGSGKGGNIDVNAERVVISGDNPHLDWPSLIRASSEGTGTDSGNAGNIQINADYLFVEKKGLISTETLGSGAGGEIGIDVNRLSLDSKGQISSSTTGAGNGGKIRISTTQFQQKGDAEVSAASTGDGNAGDIHISSTDEFLLQDSAISVEATQSDGGNIKIDNDHMVMLLNSEISSSVNGGPETVGGDINIDPEFVILQDSKIIANAFKGKGGNINIVTDVFLADSNSKIDASSDLGIDGTVDIRAAFSYLSENPAPMADDFRSAVELLREPCLARMQGGKYNSLVVRGRETLPIEPGGLLPSPAFVQ